MAAKIDTKVKCYPDVVVGVVVLAVLLVVVLVSLVVVLLDPQATHFLLEVLHE